MGFTAKPLLRVEEKPAYGLGSCPNEGLGLREPNEGLRLYAKLGLGVSDHTQGQVEPQIRVLG